MEEGEKGGGRRGEEGGGGGRRGKGGGRRGEEGKGGREEGKGVRDGKDHHASEISIRDLKVNNKKVKHMNLNSFTGGETN